MAQAVDLAASITDETHPGGPRRLAARNGPHRLAGQTIETPALLVDLDILEANIAYIAGICRTAGVGWRPHIKGVKTPHIALREIAAGAIGVTCAKLGEAEVMASAGIRDILIANQIVGPLKIARLVDLARRSEVIVAIDHADNLAEVSAAAEAGAVTVRVVIEVDIGLKRAGVEPGAAVVALAEIAARQPHIRFEGVMGWEADALLIADPGEKAAAVARAVAKLADSAELCRKAGLAVAIVSCGGTGTFPLCTRQAGITEVQAGGGVFGDMHYRTHYHFDRPPALTVLTTVTSRPTATRVILDAGKKSMSSDAAIPCPLEIGDIVSIGLSSEHSTIEMAAPSDWPRTGDHVELIAGYSDTTVHLHDTIYALRGNEIDAIWPVSARGKSS